MRFDGFEHLLSYQAEQTPDAAALVYGSRSRTYAALWAEVSARAEELRAGGKTCLGVLTDGSLACVVEIFAASIAGLQVVLLDENQPDEVLASLIKYTDADCLWGDPDLTEALAPALTGGVTDGAGKLLFFTSGTTERSKAVVLTDGSLCASAWNGSELLPLTPEDKLLCVLPLCHVFGFVCGLLWGLANGACVVLGRGPRTYTQDFALYRPTAVSLVPALLAFLRKQGSPPSSLRTMLIGAGDCPAELLSGAASGGVHVCFGYGLTETSSGVALSIGGDPYAMDICPDDTVTIAEDGEILVSSPSCMMQGYYKAPGATAAVLADGVLHTGDLGELDADGRLRITGRKKDILVLSDGTKIFLPEYEAVIIDALGHTDLAVTLRNDRPVLIYHGAGNKTDMMNRLLPRMIELPRGQQLSDILFTAEPLPRTATGKIKRWELQQKAGQL